MINIKSVPGFYNHHVLRPPVSNGFSSKFQGCQFGAMHTYIRVKYLVPVKWICGHSQACQSLKTHSGTVKHFGESTYWLSCRGIYEACNTRLPVEYEARCDFQRNQNLPTSRLRFEASQMNVIYVQNCSNSDDLKQLIGCYRQPTEARVKK